MTGPSRLPPPLAGGGRVAIIGTCVSRDLWRMAGAPTDDLLYISRTRLPSLFARSPKGLVLPQGAPPGLRPNPARALRADLSKTGLDEIIRFRPDIVLLDYMDERLDLLVGEGGVVTASAELEESGWDGLEPIKTMRRIDALGDADSLLWRRALGALSTLFMPGEALSSARPILHEAAWANESRDSAGKRQDLGPYMEITNGRIASRAAHNERLQWMYALTRAHMPRLEIVKPPSELVISDPDHFWGPNPGHYIKEYYAEIWRQLGGR